MQKESAITYRCAPGFSPSGLRQGLANILLGTDTYEATSCGIKQSALVSSYWDMDLTMQWISWKMFNVPMYPDPSGSGTAVSSRPKCCTSSLDIRIFISTCY